MKYSHVTNNTPPIINDDQKTASLGRRVGRLTPKGARNILALCDALQKVTQRLQSEGYRYSDGRWIPPDEDHGS